MARNTITTPRCPTLAEVTREVEQDPSNYFRDVDGTCHEPLWDLGHLAYNIHRDCRARFVAEVRSATQAGIALAWDMAEGKPVAPVYLGGYDPEASGYGVLVPLVQDDDIPF